MTKLEQIEKSVSELEPNDLRAFAAWFDELQAKRWDIQFENDAGNGALDAMANSAIADFKAGRSRRL